MGKAYANRKKSEDRHNNDFYETPYSLTWELLKLNIIPKNAKILDPCCGRCAISKWFKQNGYNIVEKDLSMGNDFLTDIYDENEYDFVIMNPPFDLWDDFIKKAKFVGKNVITIGKADYFSCYQRLENGIWNNFKSFYIFNRKVDYQSPIVENGDFCVGSLTSGWMWFDKSYNGKAEINFIDVQKYANLGGYERYCQTHNLEFVNLGYSDIFDIE